MEKLVLYLIRLIAILTLIWVIFGCVGIEDNSHSDLEWLPHNELRVNAESFNKIVIYNFEDCEIIMEEK